MNGTGETHTKVVTEWSPEAKADFRRRVTVGRHNLHERPEFSDEALARLIDRHPRDLTDFCTMGELAEGKESWRAGDPGDFGGDELIEAVRRGKLWINLRRAMTDDPELYPIFQGMITDLQRLNPGYRPLNFESGILISSPRARVYYHADVPGQGLIHIRGEKRICLAISEPCVAFSLHVGETPSCVRRRLLFPK